MEEIQVGEYIRFHNDNIDRIISITNTVSDSKLIGFEKKNTLISSVGFEYKIKKHSKDILDLLENKDILKVKTNEKEILYIGFDENTLDVNYKELVEGIKNKEYKLLEILPHEMYENNCYKIGE